MPPVQYGSIIALEGNNTELYMECTEVLIRIMRNILQNPDNPKYRSISLGSTVVTTKLIPALGAMQCLFEMGFQEASDKLVLPMGTSLERLKFIHDELIKRREMRKEEKIEMLFKPEPQMDPLYSSISQEITSYIHSLNNHFFVNFIYNIMRVWRCEKKSLQLKALKFVPVADLKRNVEVHVRQLQKAIRKKEIEDQVIDNQELFLMELCKWYKTNFFSWVNIKCKRCHSKETKFVGKNTTDEKDSVEVYKCSVCNDTILFPRYSDPEKLLVTRRGRCGEWVHCFYLICRALGWDVRYIIDETDHVWVEIFSERKKKWIHCDPCESLVDAPLIYECGWKKNLSYIMAYSKDDIQDVTWRYSCNYTKLLENRYLCSEEQLVDVVCTVRNILLSCASDQRKSYVIKRAALELVDLLTQRTATDAEKQGRSSGTLAWRLARGEITLDEEFKPFIWKIDKDVENKEFRLTYSTAFDQYFLGNSNKIVRGWRNGLYEVNRVLRKVENDWKMTYLAREEGCDLGRLVWRFETGDKYLIGDIDLKITINKFETGKVLCRLFTDKISINIPEGTILFSTSCFKGSKYVELLVELSGGVGNCAWQHAQIFRQCLEDRGKVFEVLIRLDEA